MRWLLVFGALWLGAGCRDSIPDTKDGGVPVLPGDTDPDPPDPDAVDADDDGWSVSDDCDDTNPAINPGVAETPYDGLDNDCDPTTLDDDLDGDGFILLADCADDDALINPDAAEICDGVDNDCDLVVDDAGGGLWHVDADGDGYGDPVLVQESCAGGGGLVLDATDCDDADPDINPGELEVCNGVDDDCDTTVDVGAIDALAWHPDDDGDGFGDAAITLLECAPPPGALSDASDCDDTDPDIRPAALEVCNGVDDNCDGLVDVGAIDATIVYADRDGDAWGDASAPSIACATTPGFSATQGDCDDAEPAAFPGNPEVCDGTDNDCDLQIDEAGAGGVIWYRDLDGDGYGDATQTTEACSQPTGYTADATDCNDRVPTVFPGAVELCDGLDNDCDLAIDEGATILGTWYLDGDGDGFGESGTTSQACTQPPGYAPAGSDCDDADADVFPGATELCNGVDDDCDAQTDEGSAADATTWFLDADLDGFGTAFVTVTACAQPVGFDDDAEDCDDLRDETYPGAPELCDGLDNDCDGAIDDGAINPVDWYTDADGDGFGDPGATVQACAQPLGTSANDDDCDDADSLIRPGSVEICDGVDQDCDGVIDDGAINPGTWYPDGDADGYGASAGSVRTCTPPSGYVASDDDCDDVNPAISPGADERCDGVDNDCDAAVDEADAVDGLTWYRDTDGDGWGNPSVEATACTQPVDYADRAGDCDDLDASISPDGLEICNGRDDDCDGSVDDGVAGATTWYRDGDGDGFGDTLVSVQSCTQPAGYVLDGTDCDDANNQVSPGRTEICDGVDNDCSGAIDDGAVDATYWAIDADGDGFGFSGTLLLACTRPPGFVGPRTDCNDADASIRPGAPELCDGVDQDCDGVADDGPVDAVAFYLDGDGDGWGDVTTVQVGCVPPAGYVTQAGDCDDAEALAYPGGLEVCDGLDNDCDGVADETGALGGTTYWRDVDADGYGETARPLVSCALPVGYAAVDGDCDDRAPASYPGAPELCDGLDNDCDLTIDEGATGLGTWYFDGDRDGFGAGASIQTCTPPLGYVAAPGDCDDNNPSVYPAAAEYCDGVDNDCDTQTDEPDALDAEMWFLDRDSDAYGDPAATLMACTAPVGYVPDDTDCNDRDDEIFPGAPELCDGLDNDCDLLVDDGASSSSLWFADGDGDGFGAGASLATCTPPPGYVANDDDCDDGSASVRPGGVELCNGVDDDCDGGIDEGAVNPRDWYQDADGDTWGSATAITQACAAPSGYVARTGDCDDADAGQRPGAPELCNGEDDDCDGAIDDSAVDAATWYADGDGDTWGNPLSTRASCTQPSGFVARGGDCGDGSASVFPGAPELCDGLDNDCDLSVDEGAAGAITWHRDADGDGFGNPSDQLAACSQPSGYVRDATDCDDTRLVVNPGRTEVCDGLDNDCDLVVDDGAVDGARWYADGDGDGVGAGPFVRACTQPSGYVAGTGDCNDGDAAIFPGAAEICDGLDNDCVGGADVGAIDATTWHRDADGDTFGNPAVFRVSCTQPSGFVANDDDCQDARASVYPGAPELCDGLDNDCDGTADDGASGSVTWYGDGDGDGFGDAADSQLSCSQPAGYVRDSRDCDDGDASISPADPEICNGIDDDCDAAIDEGGAGALPFWLDGDGDGYGDAGVTVFACLAPADYVDNDDDCDDDEALTSPDGVEICDGEDNDCDGAIDDGASGASVWYLDADRDGYGSTTTVSACAQPTGYVANDDDCDDGLSTAFPGAPERCDGEDNDCNGVIDDGSVVTATWYADVDRDGFGAAGTAITTCSPPSGYVLDGRDCNDALASVFPGAAEVCDGVDQDCDGAIDDAASDALLWYLDTDGDSYGTGSSVRACAQPSGYAPVPGDCNDALASISPSALEVCNGVDDDCDGTPDDAATDARTWYRDADRDGYGNDDFARLACTQPAGFVADGTDCIDASAVSYPGAPELCDGLDNDCDGTADDGAAGATVWYRDADGDGYGNPGLTQSGCAQPAGFVSLSGDCDDTRVSVSPIGVEVCDGLDNDCDASIDEGAVDRILSYTDGDRDGYGRSGTGTLVCAIPVGGAAVAGDCLDSNDDVYPGAPELCDGLDNNCDAIVDGPNPVGAPTWYLDFDRDGYAGAAQTVVACSAPPFHYATPTDCNDGVATAYPGAPELCDGLDNDCDAVIDDGVINPTTFYIDSDGDGYGGPTGSVAACENPGGYTSVGGDCNDGNPAISPGALEFCDTIDNNCNGQIDESTAVDAITWYLDADGDLFGNPARTRAACSQPSGYVGDNTDCNDLFASDNPLGTEVCDGRDNDCDTVRDEADAVDAPTWYFDGDGDTWGIAGTSQRRCTQPAGYAARSGDCLDTVAVVYPTATEVCDGYDNNCNGVTDGAEAIDAATWYRDADADGFGAAAVSTRACTLPSGYVSNDDDCNDGAFTVKPTGTETCNGVDDDCSTLIDDNGASCPYPVYHFEDSAYQFATLELPWAQARDWCSTRGYHLVVINSLVENFFTDGVSDSFSDAKWWTGFNDLAVEGRWVWINGDPVTYTNWHPGEPNNVYSAFWGQDEDCMQYNRYGDGTWNDEWCSQSFRFICEAEP